MKIVFIGAGSGFGAKTVVDILSFEELRSAQIVLVDINPDHLHPVVDYARKVAQAVGSDPSLITGELAWRGGVLDHGFQPTQSAQGLCQRSPVGVGCGAGGLVRRGNGCKQVFQFVFGHDVSFI